MYVNLDLFRNDYTVSIHNNGLFDSDEFIWKIKDIIDGNSHLWHQNYSIPCTKVLGFVSCRVTSKVICIGAYESSWGYEKMIKSGKIFAITSDAS